MTAFFRFIWLLVAVALAGGVSAQENRDEVTVGVLITSISGIDPADGSFDISAYAWFTDPNGTFDPEKHLEIYAREAFVKTVQRRPHQDGGLFTAVEIRATVDQLYDTVNYPFDRQELRLGFETLYDSGQLILKGDPEDLAVADFAAINGWVVEGLKFKGYIKPYNIRFSAPKLRSFSNLNVLINVKRQRSIFVVEKFIGYTVALLIAALIYFVPTDLIAVRVAMVTSAIFATVGNSYTLDADLGTTTVFGLVDKVSIITFGAIYVALATSLVSYRMRSARSPEIAERFDKWVGIIASGSSFVLAGIALYLARS